MNSGAARILKWLAMQRDLIELQLMHRRDEMDRCEAGIRTARDALADTGRFLQQCAPTVHVVSALQQRIVLDERCQAWRERQDQIERQVQELLEERQRLRQEMRRYELLQAEDDRRRRRRNAMRMEGRVDEFVMRQWEKSRRDDEVKPC